MKQIKFGYDDALYLHSRKNAPHGKILRLPLTSSDLSQAIVVVPESRGVVQNFEPSTHGLYVDELDGGPSRLRFYRPHHR